MKDKKLSRKIVNKHVLCDEFWIVSQRMSVFVIFFNINRHLPYLIMTKENLPLRNPDARDCPFGPKTMSHF